MLPGWLPVAAPQERAELHAKLKKLQAQVDAIERVRGQAAWRLRLRPAPCALASCRLALGWCAAGPTSPSAGPASPSAGPGPGAGA